MKFIKIIESSLKIKAKYNYMGMQKGDVAATWADTELLKTLTGFKAKTNIHNGIKKFINWYRNYYNI